MQELDCLIIGGGPAGMTAALYLARFGRRFAMVDAGDSRAAWIPESHTLPLFADGMNGERMLAMMRAHLGRYGVKPLRGEVVELAREVAREGTPFVARLRGEAGESVLRAPSVLLATGARDCPPDMPELRDAVQRGLIHYCPICDGYEARGKTVAVLGHGGREAAHGLAEALFLARSFGTKVSLLGIGAPLRLTGEERGRAEAAGVRVLDRPVRKVTVTEEGIACFCEEDEGCQRFETAYAALGLEVRSGLAGALGAERDSKGALPVDVHAETSVKGLFAAGDVTAGLAQIVVAMGQAAAAATAIHNRCPSPSLLAAE